MPDTYMTGNTEQSPGNVAAAPLSAALQAQPVVVFMGDPGALEVTASLVMAALWMAGVYLRGRRGRA
ncbi:hypothetical protein ACFVY0_39380 [Streptomyces sp. NPDC058286]|uniref:hypothetical protein n=1 Tax=Streptomyces sp. NPDC058286 TaxID=3346422 RepID=UPI0036ED6E44